MQCTLRAKTYLSELLQRRSESFKMGLIHSDEAERQPRRNSGTCSVTQEFYEAADPAERGWDFDLGQAAASDVVLKGNIAPGGRELVDAASNDSVFNSKVCSFWSGKRGSWSPNRGVHLREMGHIGECSLCPYCFGRLPKVGRIAGRYIAQAGRQALGNSQIKPRTTVSDVLPYLTWPIACRQLPIANS